MHYKTGVYVMSRRSLLVATGVLGLALGYAFAHPGFSKGFDQALEFLKPADLITAVDVPETGDYTYRYDAEGDNVYKVDATNLQYTLGLSPTLSVAELNIMDGVTATADEINRAADISGRVVSLTGTTVITQTLHDHRDLYVTGTAAATFTLPEAIGEGATYEFTIGEVNTNGTVIVVADITNANFVGSVISLDLDATPEKGFGAPANADTITLNGTTTGGQIGDNIRLIDIAPDVWSVLGQLQVPTGSNPVTPFSAAD